MKKFGFAFGILVLSGILIFLSCKKDDSNTDDPNPVDNTPVLTFMTGTEYVSSNVTLEVNRIFKVGVLCSKNPTTNIDIATFKVIRNLNGISETVYENSNVGESYLSWESNEVTNSEVGEETWTFTITDYIGKKKELSFVITTQAQGTLAPVIIFMEGADYVSEDTTLQIGSVFKVGINAFGNPNTNENIQNFRIIRTFNNTSTTVYEESNINSSNFTWQDNLTSNAVVGAENWNFIVIDQAGRANELSITITTTGGTPYIPSFSPTYLIVNQGGVDVLDFYITCTTDDWEMIKVIVSYPGGLGTETYVGNGQIMTQNAPFTFSNYFPKLGGVWTFSILGIIKSGQHVNESFTAVTSMTVTGK